MQNPASVFGLHIEILLSGKFFNIHPAGRQKPDRKAKIAKGKALNIELITPFQELLKVST